MRSKGRRIGRNPKTGEEVPIEPRRVMVFKPSNIMKSRINATARQDASDDAIATGMDVEKGPDAFRTISEVADDLDLPQHVLRFWETRFGADQAAEARRRPALLPAGRRRSAARHPRICSMARATPFAACSRFCASRACAMSRRSANRSKRKRPRDPSRRLPSPAIPAAGACARRGRHQRADGPVAVAARAPRAAGIAARRRGANCRSAARRRRLRATRTSCRNFCGITPGSHAEPLVRPVNEDEKLAAVPAGRPLPCGIKLASGNIETLENDAQRIGRMQAYARCRARAGVVRSRGGP